MHSDKKYCHCMTLGLKVKVIANSKDYDPGTGSNKHITTENILAEVLLLMSLE